MPGLEIYDPAMGTFSPLGIIPPVSDAVAAADRIAHRIDGDGMQLVRAPPELAFLVHR